LRWNEATDTPWERLDNAARTVFKVSKEQLTKEEERLKKLREKKRASKKPS